MSSRSTAGGADAHATLSTNFVQRFFLALLCAAFSTLVVQGWLGGLESFDTDRRFRATAQRSFSRSKTNLVEVPATQLLAWRQGAPGARCELAALLNRCREAPVVVLDFTLIGHSPDDELLAEAFRAAGNVVLRSELRSTGQHRYQLRIPTPQILCDAAAGEGYVSWIASDDGVVRRMLLHIEPSATAARRQGERLGLPWVAANVLLAHEGQPALRATSHAAALGSPVLIDYGLARPGNVISLYNVLDESSLLTDGPVIVSDRRSDGYVTPWSHGTGELAGQPDYLNEATLLSVAIDSLAQRRIYREWGPVAGYLLGLAMAFLTVTASHRLRPRHAVLAGLATGVGWVLVTDLAFRVLLVLPMVEPLLAGLMSLSLGLYQTLWTRARTAEAQHSRLNEIAEAKQQLMGTVVHDLKVPVTIVKGQALTLLSDPQRELGDELHQEFLEVIASQCDRLTSMIDDILETDPSRALLVNAQQLELAGLVRQVIAMHQAATDRHEFVVETPETLTLRADPDQLRRVLNNLVSNAVKYSPEGGRVTVRVTATDAGEASVAVSDQGLGMSAEQMSRLFGMFSRVLDDPNSIPGTGVGLFSAKRLVEAHGGRLEVESEAGAGSTFTMVLPQAAPAPSPKGDGAA